MSEPARTDEPGRTFNGIEVPLACVYDLDPVHTFITFRVRHLVVGRVRRRFTSFQGYFSVTDDAEVLFDDFEATFDPSSVYTQVDMRDEDLRGPRFSTSVAFLRSRCVAVSVATPKAIIGRLTERRRSVP